MGIKVYRCRDNVILPKYQTLHSACFDIHVNLEDLTEVESYNDYNMTQPLRVAGGILSIPPRFRVKIPTGLKFDIPTGYSVRLHPRSSMAYKKGLVLSNQEAVIDADYREQTYILLKNDSTERVKIFHGDRICQGELIQNLKYDIERTDTRPESVEGRDGGMGSTGK